jgi:hypothetical protein
MNAKEAYAEALRLIRKAEENGEVRLDLSELKLIGCVHAVHQIVETIDRVIGPIHDLPKFRDRWWE